MTSVAKYQKVAKFEEKSKVSSLYSLKKLIKQAFIKITPTWPLQNLVATNPLKGLENISFERALSEAETLFQQKDLPEGMCDANRESIKWLQPFFDEGQAVIEMPGRSRGLYRSWKKLALYDKRLHQGNPRMKAFLKSLSLDPEVAIKQCLKKLGITPENYEIFLTLILTTLQGWASLVRYRTQWAANSYNTENPITEKDYLAFRLAVTALVWPEAKELLVWYSSRKEQHQSSRATYAKIQENEKLYLQRLLKDLHKTTKEKHKTPKAQFVFCIDVRSEPLRRAIESVGEYETFGFAGFFGAPLSIKDTFTKKSHSSCPVLIKPEEKVSFVASQDHEKFIGRYESLSIVKKAYQSLKYTFTTPMVLIEFMGPLFGLWMGMRNFFPLLSKKVRSFTQRKCFSLEKVPSLDDLSIEQKVTYAKNFLIGSGLQGKLSPKVIICGHGSHTTNNAYASSLDCGACGGNRGRYNAQIMARILNEAAVRTLLHAEGIVIPSETTFFAAEHNTTTQEIDFFPTEISCGILDDLHELKEDVYLAETMLHTQASVHKRTPLVKKSLDWAEVRPEWGLAKNASFIIAPREATAEINLDGRAFLHSYRAEEDSNGSVLESILAGPLVVAQWINAQYLFSTLDNVAYGGGSKVTSNITGKIGIMQGNASDLMSGLSLQSVYRSDNIPYHIPQRLSTLIYAPQELILQCIERVPKVKELVQNSWIKLFCIDQKTKKASELSSQLTWLPFEKG